MTTLGVIIILVPTMIAAIIAYMRRDLRSSMLWAGLLAVPVLLGFPLTFHLLRFPFGLLRLLTLFSFGAVAAAVYELLFSKYFRLKKRSRRPLLIMLAGPVIVLLGTMAFGQTIGPLVFALLLEIALIVIFRRDLLWDLLFSGFAMAILYTLLVIIATRVLGAPIGSSLLDATAFSGVVVLGIPLEEVAAIALFGALWGPMYPAFKDMKLRD